MGSILLALLLKIIRLSSIIIFHWWKKILCIIYINLYA